MMVRGSYPSQCPARFLLADEEQLHRDEKLFDHESGTTHQQHGKLLVEWNACGAIRLICYTSRMRIVHRHDHQV